MGVDIIFQLIVNLRSKDIILYVEVSDSKKSSKPMGDGCLPSIILQVPKNESCLSV